MKNFGGESILRADGSSPLSRMSRASFEQVDRLEIEDGLRVGLIAALRIVAAQDQQVLDALRCGADQVARERDAIAIAARDLQDRLVTVRGEDRGGREAADRGLAGRGVGHVDRVDLALELAGLVRAASCRRPTAAARSPP